MAKLSAHGSELARIIRDLPDSEHFIDQTETRVLMSDGWILKKWSYRFKSISSGRKENISTQGWKLCGRLASFDPKATAALQETWTPLYWLTRRLQPRPDGCNFRLIHAHGIPEYKAA